jgi:hypothetical protein
MKKGYLYNKERDWGGGYGEKLIEMAQAFIDSAS